MAGSNTDAQSDYARVKVLVSGRVQGVGFRSFAGRYANALGLTGWVKNLYDGRVEVVAEGERKKILRYIRFLEEGSPWSRVDNVSVEWCPYKGDLSFFMIK
ncbi:MAG: acylphosphatase [Firmicutes bacterium]|nr:acylphosphatase [Bacillota bacterium]HXL05095.1 acylphosphatase [Bacillota bacterium]